MDRRVHEADVEGVKPSRCVKSTTPATVSAATSAMSTASAGRRQCDDCDLRKVIVRGGECRSAEQPRGNGAREASG